MIVFQSAFRAVEDMHTPFLIVAASGVVNAVLDPILIYPLGMGIAGAAWATSIAQIAGAAIFIDLIRRRAFTFGLPQAWAVARASVISRGSAAMPAAPRPSAYSSRVITSATPPAAPTVSAPGGSAAAALNTAAALCRALPWWTFTVDTAKLALRCLLVLSTWTLAAGAATSLGTYSMAAYQIMQQVLQLQLSICWAFLAVGQSLVGVKIAQAQSAEADREQEASVPPQRGASSNGGLWSPQQRAARVVARRVVEFSVVASMAMACVTWGLRSVVPRIFTDNVGVLQMVQGSVLLMCVMLALGWNNALEGVLMGAQDTDFVINIYPICVGVFAVMLGAAHVGGWGLPGIWGALVLYYVGLACCLSARFWYGPCRARI